MIEDSELLRRYVDSRSQDAFTELVRRRVDLVYSVALRQVGGDAHLAEDVTQKVFADLARKAATLLDRPVLSGWLYRSAQFAGSDMVRSERRRRTREQETYTMQELTASPESPERWERLRPLLDEAMGELSDPDRDAVALRFFEGRPFGDIGRALRLNEDAARKRVERALDKMAAGLSRRGVTSTSAALGAALVGQGMVAAPAGLAASVAGAAIAGAGTVAAGAGFLGFMGTTSVSVGVSVVAVLAIGTTIHGTSLVRQREAELAALGQQQVELRARLGSLEQELKRTFQSAQASDARALAAEEDSAKLLAAIQSHGAQRAADSAFMSEVPLAQTDTPLTQAAVQARYRRGQELARTGDPAEALRELLWCFDTGMPAIGSFSGVRRSFLLSDIARLGAKHPPALAALRERRDAAERAMLASGDYEPTANFAAINGYLKEQDRTLAVFDAIPADDPRRRRLASSAFDELREQRRYQDALVGRTFVQMTQQFEHNAEERPVPANIADPERIRRAQRQYLVTSTVRHIEVLAGAGKVEQARVLAQKLLAHDSSADTRAVLQRHVERAGQPNLLTATGPK